MNLKVPVADPAEYLTSAGSKACSVLQAPAMSMPSIVGRAVLASNKNLLGIAAPAIYVAFAPGGETETRLDAAEWAGTQEVTFCKAHRQLRKILDFETTKRWEESSRGH